MKEKSLGIFSNSTQTTRLVRGLPPKNEKSILSAETAKIAKKQALNATNGLRKQHNGTSSSGD